MVRYLNPADHNPKRITKADKDFAKRFDFNDIKFPVKIRISLALAFLVIKIRKNIQFMYQNNIAKKNILTYHS